jgi:toxin ParE1/3/4
MTRYRLLRNAQIRIGEIYDYSRGRWGAEQADRYYNGLFDKFVAIATRQIPWRPIPATFAVRGFCCRYERHTIYWRVLEDDSVGIVTILHERMAHPPLVREAFND